MNEIDILKDVADKLTKNNIAYMISGSVAMNFYTIPRMTRDIDIVILIDNNDIDKIFAIFKDDYYIDKDMIKDAVKNLSIFNIIHLKEVIKIDFIIRKDDEYRILEFNNRKKIKIDNNDVYIVSLEDLIISKLFWEKDSFSEVQTRDIKNLVKNDYNVEYVKKWCANLNILNLFNRILNE